MDLRLFEVKWEYTHPDTNRRMVINEDIAASTRNKAIEKRDIYKGLYESTLGTKLKMVKWRERRLGRTSM